MYPIKGIITNYLPEPVDIESYRDQKEKHELHLEAFYAGKDFVFSPVEESCYITDHVIMDDIDPSTGQHVTNLYLMIVRPNGNIELRAPDAVKADYKELELLYREQWQSIRRR
jgi:hypothetical protein